MADARLEVEVGANINRLTTSLKSASKQINDFGDNSEKPLGKVEGGFKALGGQLATLVTAGALVSFGKQVINVTQEFEKFQAVLTNTLGSQAIAKLRLSELTDFAAKTPFSVRELTESFVKLANQGFTPTTKQLRQLGDLAASTGKSFDQLAEAVLDAQTGEFERLKEFGIRAKDAGDSVIFTYKGVQTQVEKSSGAIREYITALGDAQGVSGSMAAISETLSGKISNLGDAWDQMLKTIGDGTSGVFKSVIDILSTGISKITEFNRRLNVASKFGLRSSSSASDAASGLISPLAGIINLFKGNDKAGFIDDLAKGLNESNSSFISGAKNVSDYNKKISELGRLYQLSIKGVTDPNLKRAITTTYADAIKAIRDSAKKLVEERNKAEDANFGRTKKSKKSKLDSRPGDLDYVKDNFNRNPSTDTGKVATVGIKDIEATSRALSKAAIEAQAQIDGLNAAANDGIAVIGVSIVNGLGAAFEALTSGGNPLQAFGDVILSGIASFLGEFGKYLIKFGLAAGAFATLQKALLNPITAIPAATAAVAIGAVLVALSGAIGGLMSGGSRGGSVGSSVSTSGPTTPNFSNGPRSLNALSNSNGSMQLVASVSGKDLQFVLSHETNRRGRVG